MLLPSFGTGTNVGGEIYQFVVDEAVITWKTIRRFDYEKCIELYYNYMDYLNRRKSYNLKRHGNIPMFRCAIHCRKVSIALVGDYKKEIAYHGDVLNLCTRLQSVCVQNQAEFLVSGRFLGNVNYNEHYRARLILLTILKGVNKDQFILSIKRKLA